MNGGAYGAEIFDNIVPIDASTGKTNRQYMLEVRQYLTDWTRNFDKNHGNLLLMGSPGTGKTFLINCVARELIQSSHSVIYLTSTDLFESFSKASFQGDAVQQDLNEAILSCDLLVIDDLGTELNNSFTTSRLFYVINQRMVYGRSVIISTNLSLSRLRDSYSAKARELAAQLLSLQVGAGLFGGSGLEGHFKNLNMRGHEAGLG